MEGNPRMSHDNNNIVLDKILDFEVASEFCALLNAIDVESDVTLDGSQVTSIDTSALQLLTALAIQVRNNGCRIIWVSPSELLLNTARLTGLTAQLGLEAV
ncbi:MAG: STAS domain-containing protein [Gammaproteobacteria bacterium]